jgi:hypothetical protein
MPNWVSLNNIEVYLYSQVIVVKALTSGSPFNGFVKPSYKPWDQINFLPQAADYSNMREINLGSKYLLLKLRRLGDVAKFKTKGEG